MAGAKLTVDDGLDLLQLDDATKKRTTEVDKIFEQAKQV